MRFQPCQHQQHRAFVGERAARESGASAARHEWDVERGEETDDGDQLFARAGRTTMAGTRRCVGKPSIE